MITAQHIQDALMRLDLATTESVGIDEFLERYEVTDDAMQMLFMMFDENIPLLTEALIKDLGSKEAARHVPAWMHGTLLKAFVLGYVTCLISQDD